MNRLKKCRIISVGKRRDGGTRYWCLEHRSGATAKYGQPASKCCYEYIPPKAPNKVITLDVARYKGGIALWGAVQPIYDTTCQQAAIGIHVHARMLEGDTKDIDNTYSSVSLIDSNETLARQHVDISELDAIYYMITSIFGYSMKYVECTFCGFPHLDEDWFSVHPHQSHLCTACGRYFRDNEIAIGNPVMMVKKLFPRNTPTVKLDKKTLEIRQADFPGGIQLWGSHSAILWTAPRSEEEGIHIHAMSNNGKERLLDDTFSDIIIDNIHINSTMVRIFMAQTILPHLEGRVLHIYCPRCHLPHFDIGDLAVTPHMEHLCISCGLEFQVKGRIRKTIGNPIIGIIDKLAQSGPHVPQKYKTTLLGNHNKAGVKKVTESLSHSRNI